MELINTFESKINTLHIELSKEQYSQYVTYYNMVVEKNKVMNLTGITEFDEFIDKHYIDSLSIVNAVDMTCVNRSRFSGNSIENCFSAFENYIVGFFK